MEISQSNAGAVSRPPDGNGAFLFDEASRPHLRRLGLKIGLLTLLFGLPLTEWAIYGWSHDVQSYLVLIPFISGYLIWLDRQSLPFQPGGFRAATVAWVALGTVSIAMHLGVRFGMFRGFGGDALTFSTLSWVSFLFAVLTLGLGPRALAALRFPLGFLLLMVPIPELALDGIETGLQHASAEVASWFFSAAAIPNLRDGLVFRLPGITIEVAQECSGVRSTLVLFVTSLVAGHLFLAKTANRLMVTLATVVLGVLRNGFRILVIAWLCVEQGPHMIHSPIHKQGGPIFFAIALIPLGLLFVLLMRRERTLAAPSAAPPHSPPSSPVPPAGLPRSAST